MLAFAGCLALQCNVQRLGDLVQPPDEIEMGLERSSLNSRHLAGSDDNPRSSDKRWLPPDELLHCALACADFRRVDKPGYHPLKDRLNNAVLRGTVRYILNTVQASKYCIAFFGSLRGDRHGGICVFVIPFH